MDLRGKAGLLIDDLPEMRNSLRIQLTDAGLEQCDTARNVREAIDRVSARRYDLIVSDYSLGQGADGQQLLELLRRRELLPLSTAFMMITGESQYEQVATAAEFAPDDYLIKPFTSQLLATRLGRILDKKEALRPVLKYLGPKGDPDRALASCVELLTTQPRYVADIQRLQGELLLKLHRADEALAHYDMVMNTRASPWAAVGRARALEVLGRTGEARQVVASALDAYPNYLAAYDTLAHLVEADDPSAAQTIAERALQVAPSTHRQRQVGALALNNGDYARAELAYRKAVERDRSGFFKSHDDYAGLTKSCLAQGKLAEAQNAVKEMGTAFAPSLELDARRAAMECEVLVKAGNTQGAQAALQRALTAGREAKLGAAGLLDLAGACFAAGAEEQAHELIRQVAEDHDENPAVLAAARSVFERAGQGERADEFLASTRANLIRLNNEAVALARAGEHARARTMLIEAADRLGNNAQIALNAALSLLQEVQRGGGGKESLAQAHRYLTQAKAANPRHPRLNDIANLYRRLAGSDEPPTSTAP